MKRLVMSLLAIAVLLQSLEFMTIKAKADELVYSDVSDTHWAYTAILRTTELGLFSGYTMEDGSQEFRPGNVMTRGHFITVIARAFLSDRLVEIEEQEGKGERFFTNPYRALIECGILKDGEISYDSLDEPCKRQEMALLLVRSDMFMWPYASLEEMDFTSEDVLEGDEDFTYQIPDLFESVDWHYRNYVIFAYVAGYLGGVDKTGAFHGQDSVTRAQGAVVLTRLLDEIASWDSLSEELVGEEEVDWHTLIQAVIDFTDVPINKGRIAVLNKIEEIKKYGAERTELDSINSNESFGMSE